MNFNRASTQAATLISVLDACDTATQLDREDRLLTSQGKDNYVFLWRSSSSDLVVSQQDTRLPSFEASCQTLLKSSGYRVLARRSGGSGFPLTTGMLNISIIKNAPERPSIRKEYRWFCNLLSDALTTQGLNIDTHTVDEAYCDGAYNLCLQGKKIAGTSQRWAQGPNGYRQLFHCGLLIATNIERDCEAVNLFYAKAGAAKNPVSASVHRNIDIPMQSIINTLQSHIGRALGTQ